MVGGESSFRTRDLFVSLVCSQWSWNRTAGGATPRGPSRQHCRTHVPASLVALTPDSAQQGVVALPHSIQERPNAEAVRALCHRVLAPTGGQPPAPADHLDVTLAATSAMDPSNRPARPGPRPARQHDHPGRDIPSTPGIASSPSRGTNPRFAHTPGLDNCSDDRRSP